MELTSYIEIVERLIYALEKEYMQAINDGASVSQIKSILETLEDLNRTVAFLKSRSPREKSQ
jgi:hypothetical protein